MIMTRPVLRRKKKSFLFFSFNSAQRRSAFIVRMARLPRRAACKADRLLLVTSVCDLLRFRVHSGGQGSKQQHEWISSTAAEAAVPAPASIGVLLAELDSNAKTNCSFSSVAYRSPSLLSRNQQTENYVVEPFGKRKRNAYKI